jgi:hypothetical protein
LEFTANAVSPGAWPSTPDAFASRAGSRESRKGCCTLTGTPHYRVSRIVACRTGVPAMVQQPEFKVFLLLYFLFIISIALHVSKLR